ncbi:hypothetical protein F5Y14DRAFT_337621 [Nemania sp. NC0429]|nr:hypothetical protein F5Y14DRAFT_337621 [Nemania sp. NC0429]
MGTNSIFYQHSIAEKQTSIAETNYLPTLPYLSSTDTQTFHITMSSHSDIQYLHKIADNLSTQPRKHEADALLELIQREAVAFREPESSKLRALAICYENCMNVHAISRPMEKDARMSMSPDLNRSLQEWFMAVDECFFFKTLTRSTERGPVVTLRVTDEHEALSSDYAIHGAFQQADRSITVRLNGEKYGAFSMTSVMLTVAHESIHALLHIFADIRSPKYREQVSPGADHGPIFIKILHLIEERIGEITGDSLWDLACFRSEYGRKEPPGYWEKCDGLGSRIFRRSYFDPHDRDSSHRGLDSSRRGLLSSRRGLLSSHRGLDSSRRGLLSSRRGLLSSRRGLFSSRRGLLSSRRGLLSSGRGHPSSASGRNYPFSASSRGRSSNASGRSHSSSASRDHPSSASGRDHLSHGRDHPSRSCDVSHRDDDPPSRDYRFPTRDGDYSRRDRGGSTWDPPGGTQPRGSQSQR